MKVHCPVRVLSWAVLLLGFGASAQGGEVTARYQVTGLFCKERVADLKETVAQIPGVKLLDVDYEKAEATFQYDPKETFRGAKPEEVVKHLDNKVRSASRHTFGVRPVRKIPRDKLKFVEIKVAGCLCKACSLAAYEAVYRLEGVEQATASFREGRVTALIDPAKTDRARLKAALKKRGVIVKD